MFSKWALKSVCVTLLFMAVGCANIQQEKQTLIFKYSDFGSAAQSYELLGSEWWQWWPHGDGNPDTRYDVKVVVYQNVSAEELAKQFPVVEEKQQDYRYVTKSDALEYLVNAIEELEAMRKEMGVAVTPSLVQLKKTQKKIIDYF